MRVTVKQTNKKEVVTVGIQGPTGATGVTSVSAASDVDVTNLKDGSVLVYSAQDSKWTATDKLEKQILDAGQF